MYHKILVITDNKLITQRVDQVFDHSHFEDVKWAFAISPASDLNEFKGLVSRDFFVADLRNDAVVEKIISTYDLVISIHCKQLFPPKMVNSVKCINVHPGYNPLNRGWYPQVFAIINNWEVGATIHEINEQLDHGNIIVREFVKKEMFDNSEDLYNRIVDKEIELFEKNIASIVSGTYSTFAPENNGNLFLKKDFDALREIDLNRGATYGEVIRHLLAMTHGEFKNAYARDPETGTKYYFTLTVTPESNK